VTVLLDEGWERLTSFRDAFTCYSSAIAAWVAHDDRTWPQTINAGLWLSVAEHDDGLFGFGHFPPGFGDALRLSVHAADDAIDARAAIAAEIERHGRVIVAADGYNLHWHVAHGRSHVPHWFTILANGQDATIVDPFAFRNELGWQEPVRVPIDVGELDSLILAVPYDDPVFRLREAWALGDGRLPVERHAYRWLSRAEGVRVDAPSTVQGPAAIRQLAKHFSSHGQDLGAYRQADDLWSIGRHRLFLAKVAGADPTLTEWVTAHADPIARRWSHVPPLLMQATLALESGRAASASVPETLEALAELEVTAASTLPA